MPFQLMPTIGDPVGLPRTTFFTGPMEVDFTVGGDFVVESLSLVACGDQVAVIGLGGQVEL